MWAPVLQVKTALLVAGLGAMGADPSDGKKVLLIVNEPNEKVYLSGRNIPTLAINTSHAVQVRRSDAVRRGGSGLGWGWDGRAGRPGWQRGNCAAIRAAWCGSCGRQWPLLVPLAHQPPACSAPPRSHFLLLRRCTMC